MKRDIHPENYRKVIFLDTSSDEKFLLGSTIETDETGAWEDGEEYPLARVEMSSASHPFYTGVERTVDTAGRVEKFKARFEKARAAKKTKQETAENTEEEGEEATDDQSETTES
ncbi:MAG: type B 50S ribosomal protein L31 [Candidatus Paceibacterota bacterium]